MSSSLLSTEISDPVNARILAVSEDRIAGFHEDPFAEIARLSDLPVETVIDRLRAMLEAGVVRRIRQTLMATNLAPGALVAWRVPAERLDAAFDYLDAEDPFSGHVVIRSTDAETHGLGVPAVDDAQGAAGLLDGSGTASCSRSASAPTPFASCRRSACSPSASATCDAAAWSPAVARTSRARCSTRTSSSSVRSSGASSPPSSASWRRDEVRAEPWRARAEEAGVAYEEFLRVARGLSASDA